MAEPNDHPRFTTQAPPPADTPTPPGTPAPTPPLSDFTTRYSPDAQTAANPEVATLGRYEVIAEVARGGMGVVYRCRDGALNRELAVKVVLGRHADRADILRRFTEEAQIAGQLQHPGVVPVFELGELSDGRPFLAMKLVKGRTLAELLGERASPADDLHRFLNAFLHVCHTVAYAHSKGVVHRDLKPHNVMVGAFGEVQVMDWGLAKTLGGAGNRPGVSAPDPAGSVVDTDRPAAIETRPGAVLGTPAYMPPEQALGEVDRIDERSDVFGLGAILCEILTGQPPYAGPDAGSVRRQVAEARLDDTVTRLRGCGAEPELVRLAVRCLAPRKSDRPADAGEVAAEVAAYQAAVQERLQQERVERERQQIRGAELRRRRRLVSVATVAVLLTLSLGTVASTVFALGERAARKEATRQFENAELILGFLTDDVFSLADPGSEPNRDITLRAAVDRAAEKLGQRFNEAPEVKARLLIELGKVYFNLGEYGRSRDLFDEARSIASDKLGETHPTALKALDQLGKAYMFLEDFPNAQRVLSKAYELQKVVLGPEHEDTIHTYAKLGDLAADMGDREKAVEITQQVLAMRRRLWGDEYEFTLVSRNGLGLLYREMGRNKEAVEQFELAFQTARRTLSENHPSTLEYENNCGLVYADLEDWGKAEELFAHCLTKKQERLGKNHFSTLATENNLVAAMIGLGKHDEARERLESILERLGPDIGADHSFRGVVLAKLGRCLTALGKYEAAEAALLQAKSILEKKYHPDHKVFRTIATTLEELRTKRGTPTKENNRNGKPRP